MLAATYPDKFRLFYVNGEVFLPLYVVDGQQVLHEEVYRNGGQQPNAMRSLNKRLAAKMASRIEAVRDNPKLCTRILAPK